MVTRTTWRQGAMILVPPLLAGIVLGANQARAGANLSWPLSILFWLTLSFVTWSALVAATALARIVLRPWQPPGWSIWILGGVAGSLVARPLIYQIAELFRPLMGGAAVRAMPPMEPTLAFAATYFSNWSLILAMWIATCWLISRQPEIAPGQPVPASAPDARAPGFLRRLPPAIGRDVIALQAEDHYVRVHTRAGNALVLTGISEAIQTLAEAGVAGQRVHRSWWVAAGAVAGLESEGRRTQAVLATGLHVPVSQTYREAARAAGMFRV